MSIVTETKYRPFIAREHEVRSILERRQTQFRRAIKGIPENYRSCSSELDHIGQAWFSEIDIPPSVAFSPKEFENWNHVYPVCPFGKPGDRLYLKETWKPDVYGSSLGISGFTYKADGKFIEIENSKEAAVHWLSLRRPEEQWPKLEPPKWRSPVTMPREVSRITLEVKRVWVERIQDISEQDAIACGVYCVDDDPYDPMYLSQPPSVLRQTIYSTAQKCYASMRPKDWNANVFDWCVEFGMIQEP